MTTVAYSAFLPEVLQYAPSAPDIIATNAIRNACVEFGETTRYLQQDMTPLNIVAATSAYTPAVGTDLVFIDVVQAWANNALLIGKAPEELARIYRWQDWRTVTGAPTYITREIRTQIILVPQPVVAVTSGLTARIAVGPSRSSSTVDNEVLERFLEVIVDGALARLYATPDQPYSNPQMAAMRAVAFKHKLTEIRAEVNRGLSRTPTRVEYQRFA